MLHEVMAYSVVMTMASLAAIALWDRRKRKRVENLADVVMFLGGASAHYMLGTGVLLVTMNCWSSEQPCLFIAGTLFFVTGMKIWAQHLFPPPR